MTTRTAADAKKSDPRITRAPRKWAVRWVGLRSRRLAWVAVGFLVVVTLAAVIAPLVAPFNPDVGDFTASFQGPSWGHLLGTDELGRDLLSRVIYGGRVSLGGVGEAVGIFLLFGLIVGLVAGYVGGWFEEAVVWVAELSFGIPQIVVVLAVLSILSSNSSAAMIIYGVLGAPGLAVVVRGATASVRREPYIAAARVSGLRTGQILRRHVLPRIAGPVIVITTFFACGALLFQTGLDFLGLGTHPPTPSWGAMVAEGGQNLFRDGWMMVPSGLAIVLTVVSFGIIGDAVRDSRAGLSTEPVARLGVGVDVRARGSYGGVAGEDGQGMPSGKASSSSQSLSGGTGGLTLPARPGAILSVRGLSVAVRDGRRMVPIVEGVTFDLSPGEVLGVVGESGSGKTMTLLAILGMLPPGVEVTGGSAWFDGVQLVGKANRRFPAVRGSGIGMIFQEPIGSLDPCFTVGSQLAEVVREHKSMSRSDARSFVLRLLDRVRLPDAQAVASRYPYQLSGGMAQRVAIAAAIAGGPRVLFADEPTTALDVTVQAEILDLIRELQVEEGLAVVIVSHDWGVIADTCDSALVMYAGQVVEVASTVEVFANPLHPYIYGLLMSDPHRIHEPRTKLPSIRGSVLPVGMWPVGCRFRERCDFATTECWQGIIKEEMVGRDHRVRCIHHAEIAAGRVDATKGRLA